MDDTEEVVLVGGRTQPVTPEAQPVDKDVAREMDVELDEKDVDVLLSSGAPAGRAIELLASAATRIAIEVYILYIVDDLIMQDAGTT